MDNKQNMKRREFLKNSALLLLSGKAIFDIGNNYYSKSNLKKIYGELPEYVCTIRSEQTYDVSGKEKKRTNIGGVIRLGNKLITCYHNVKDSPYEIKTSLGLKNVPPIQKERKLIIYGLETKILKHNQELDTAVLELGDGLEKIIKPFPCKTRDVKLGEMVYMIGNPHNLGTFVKSGRVGRLKRHSQNEENTKGCFTINMPTVSGDSGSPIISKDYKLVGISHAGGDRVRAYATFIKHYLDLMGEKDFKTENKEES